MCARKKNTRQVEVYSNKKMNVQGDQKVIAMIRPARKGPWIREFVRIENHRKTILLPSRFRSRSDTRASRLFIKRQVSTCWLKNFHGCESRIIVNLARFSVTLPDGERSSARQKINQGIDNYQLSNRLSDLEARTGLAYIHENNRKSI